MIVAHVRLASFLPGPDGGAEKKTVWTKPVSEPNSVLTHNKQTPKPSESPRNVHTDLKSPMDGRYTTKRLEEEPSIT